MGRGPLTARYASVFSLWRCSAWPSSEGGHGFGALLGWEPWIRCAGGLFGAERISRSNYGWKGLVVACQGRQKVRGQVGASTCNQRRV